MENPRTGSHGCPPSGQLHCSDDVRSCLIAVGSAPPIKGDLRIRYPVDRCDSWAALSVYPASGYQPC